MPGKNTGLGPHNPTTQAAFVLIPGQKVPGQRVPGKSSPHCRVFGDFYSMAYLQSGNPVISERLGTEQGHDKRELGKALNVWAEFAQRCTKCWSWSQNPNSSSNSPLIVWMPSASPFPPLGLSFRIYEIETVSSSTLPVSRVAVASCTAPEVILGTSPFPCLITTGLSLRNPSVGGRYPTLFSDRGYSRWPVFGAIRNEKRFGGGLVSRVRETDLPRLDSHPVKFSQVLLCAGGQTGLLCLESTLSLGNF